jgi:hypothetical protein
LVTNAPGYPGALGDDLQNEALYFPTPHTSRHGKGHPWQVAPVEIGRLLARFRKPVVDDEPARNGTSKFGGPKMRTWPADHILQIAAVWERGAMSFTNTTCSSPPMARRQLRRMAFPIPISVLITAKCLIFSRSASDTGHGCSTRFRTERIRVVGPSE